jgi:hypothetical protein
MLLFLVVRDVLTTSKNWVWTWHLDSIDHLFKCKATVVANYSEADGT